MPILARSSAGHLSKSTPSKLMLPEARLQQAHDAFQQRGLAHAVAAHQAHERAGRDDKIHIPQGVAAAVELIEALDRQHAYPPR